MRLNKQELVEKLVLNNTIPATTRWKVLEGVAVGRLRFSAGMSYTKIPAKPITRLVGWGGGTANCTVSPLMSKDGVLAAPTKGAGIPDAEKLLLAKRPTKTLLLPLGATYIPIKLFRNVVLEILLNSELSAACIAYWASLRMVLFLVVKRPPPSTKMRCHIQLVQAARTVALLRTKLAPDDTMICAHSSSEQLNHW